MQFWERLGESSFRDSLARAIRFHNPGFNPAEFGSFPNVEELLSRLLVNEQLFDSSREYEGNFTKQERLRLAGSEGKRQIFDLYKFRNCGITLA